MAFLNYAHAVDLALREHHANNAARADRLLADCPPDLRGWEWHYVHRLCHPEVLAVRGASYALFSPDGRRVATDAADKKAHVRDTDTGRELVAVAGAAAAFSGDGARFATIAVDNTARIWDAETGKELAVLRGHTKLVNSVAFTDDGTRVVTTANDNTARVWDATTGGGNGNDQLYGDNGNDRIDGGAGNDGLYGQAGDDYLVGGPGVDRFDGGIGTDRVADYQSGEAFLAIEYGVPGKPK